MPPVYSEPQSIQVAGTLRNDGTSTVYYRDEYPVSATLNDGSLGQGQSVALTGVQWIACAAGQRSNVTVTPDPVIVTTGTSSGSAHTLATWDQPGTIAVATGKGRIPLPAAATLVAVRTAVNTAPTGASIIVDVNKNGTTVFTTQANRPTIAASGFASGNAVPDVTAVAAGDYLTVDIDQVGSTVAGADLTVVVELLLSTGTDPAPASLTISEGQVTGLVTDLAAKADLVGGKVPSSQLGSGGGGAGTKALYDDGTFKTASGGSDTSESAWKRSDVVASNIPRRGTTFVNGTSSITSGKLMYTGGLVIPAGSAVTAIRMYYGTNSSGLTHSWAAIVDNAATPNVLAKSTDDTTEWNAAGGLGNSRTLTLSSSLASSGSDRTVGVVFCFVYTTTPPACTNVSATGTIAQWAPTLAATLGTGFTDPASLGSTVTAPAPGNAIGTHYYVELI